MKQWDRGSSLTNFMGKLSASVLKPPATKVGLFVQTQELPPVQSAQESESENWFHWH